MPILVVHPPVADTPPVRCQVPSDLEVMNDDAFFDWCQENDELRIERTSKGEIEIMSPAGWESGSRNSELSRQLGNWAIEDYRGVTSDSSTGYVLPNRAERSPDASWTLKERLREISPESRRKFLPLCPDFVIELRSPSDGLSKLQMKMEEYLSNGASLGWLIDPVNRTVQVYRPSVDPETLVDPKTVKGEGLVEGFVLELGPVFDLDL